MQSQAGGGVALSVAFGHFQDAVKLTFKDGSVFHTTFAGPDTDELREQEIGTFEPDTRHVVVLKLYRRRNTYDLSILGGVDGTPGGGNIALTDQPLLDTGIWDAANVRLDMRYLVNPAAPTGTHETYLIDNISISKGGA